MSDSPAAPNTKQIGRQFSIARLLLWMTVVAVLLAGFVNGGTTGTIKGQFTTLPADDKELQAWYAKEDPGAKVTIERRGRQLVISEHRLFAFRYFSPRPPPWDKLGYSQQTSWSESFQMSLFRFPFHLVAIFILAVVIDWWLKRQAKNKAALAEVIRGENPNSAK